MSWRPSGTRLDSRDWRDALCFFLVALATYAVTCPGASGYDQYALLARAVLHGSLSLPERPPALEMAEWQGRAYFTNPPTPALLLVPVIWIAERARLRAIGAEHRFRSSKQVEIGVRIDATAEKDQTT